MSVIRVVLVDDDARFRRVVATVLAADPRVEQVGEAGDASGAVDLVTATKPDCVLMDVRMPGGGGPQATRAVVSECHPPPAVVAVSADDSLASVASMLTAGATGYLLKGEIGDVLVDLVVRCARGEVVLATPRAAAALREAMGRRA